MRFRRYFSSTFKRLIDCNSCGVKLQNKQPGALGYYTKKDDNLVKKITLEDVKYLIFGQDIQRIKEMTVDTENYDIKLEKPLICKRCSEALHNNKYNATEFKDIPFEEVEKQIPIHSNVVHTAPILEFPFHINSQLLKNRTFNTTMVFTKADRVFKNKKQVQKQIPIFLDAFFETYLNSKATRNIVTSTLNRWNLDTLFSFLHGTNYFVGEPNSGKSTLINALLRRLFGVKIRGNDVKNFELDKQAEEELAVSKKFFLEKQLAGVSHIPNLTRTLQAYKIKQKIIYDLPGYSNYNSYRIDEFIDPKWLQRFRKTSIFSEKRVKKKRYDSIVGNENGKCLTLGGIFYLVPPPTTINQIVCYIPGELRQFHNTDRGIEVLGKSGSKEHPLNKCCGIKPGIGKEKYIRHIIPPFQGPIEVVLKDIGYFSLTPTGKYEYKGLYELWVLDGIDVCIRKPLERVAEDSYDKSQEGKYYIKEPVVSHTYVVAHNDPNPLQTVKETYEKVKERTDEILNKYNLEKFGNNMWHFKW